MNSYKNNKLLSNFTIFLYDDLSSEKLDLKKIEKYVKHKIGNIKIVRRKSFLNCFVDSDKRDKLAEEIARCRVRNKYNPDKIIDPLPVEIRYEKKFIEHPDKRPTGVLYDGYKLNTVYRDLIKYDEINFFDNLHIVFTNRLFGTFDQIDKRYHARAILCGIPCFISTTGLVEALAKPRDYYVQKQKYLVSPGKSIPNEKLKSKFNEKIIDYNDPRLTEIMKGYTMQAIFNYITGEPFCSDENCRLYNAHRQEEMINAQLEGDDFCEKHKQFLNSLKNSCERD